MRREIPRTLVALLLLAATACASSGGADATADARGGTAGAATGTSSAVTLTRVGEAVQVTEDAETTHECEFVAHLPLTGTSVSDVNVIRAVRNEAGRSGANFVLLVMEGRYRIARAEGYLCAD